MGSALEILHCDNHLLVVAKPACVPVVPDESGDESLFDRSRAWIRATFEKPGQAFLGVVQRLDRPVSGVVVFARTSKSAARLAEQFRSRRVGKLYWGIAEGELPGSEGTLEQWLVKDERKNLVRVVEHQAGQARRALTRWRVLARDGKRAWLELRPETGRPHQLRVAAASLGAPLVGDLKYGAERPLPDKSIALHAFALEFDHPTLGERMRFQCEPPGAPTWKIVRQ